MTTSGDEYYNREKQRNFLHLILLSEPEGYTNLKDILNDLKSEYDINGEYLAYKFGYNEFPTFLRSSIMSKYCHVEEAGYTTHYTGVLDSRSDHIVNELQASHEAKRLKEAGKKLKGTMESNPRLNYAPRNFNGPRRLFVGGLSKFTTIESMNEYFRKFGNVSNCGIKINKETGALKNSGYVEFESALEANIALNALPHVIDGKEVGLMPYGRKETRSQRRNYKLIIRRLPDKILQTTLRNYYSQFGEILACYIVRTEANESRHFAFVVFNSEEAVSRALNSLPHCIDGNEIKDVKRAGVRDRKLTLRVLDLSPQTTEESLRTFYSKFGKLTRCNIANYGSVKDIASEKTPLVGLVAFESKEELDRALETEPHVIDGSEVFLQHLTHDFDLWIHGVPEGITEDSLYNYFSKYGELRDCRIYSSASGTKHADVCYTSSVQVNRALADRPHIINGKLLKIKSADKAKKTTFSIFVGSLPETATEKSVLDEFSQFGKLVYWEFTNDDKLSKTGLYAVVTYGTLEEALEALNNEHVIEGTVVDVRKASEVAASMKENFV